MRHTEHGPGLYTAVPVGTVPMGTPCTTTEFARGVGICAFGFFFLHAQAMMSRRSARPTAPPTAPPAIAPTLSAD